MLTWFRPLKLISKTFFLLEILLFQKSHNFLVNFSKIQFEHSLLHDFMTTTTFFTRVLAAIFIALWGKPLWDPFTQGFINVAMLCTSLSKLRTFTNFDTFDFFFTVVIMDNLFLFMLNHRTWGEKLEKEVWPGAPDCLVQTGQCSQTSLEDSSMIEILQMGGAGQGNSARAT